MVCFWCQKCALKTRDSAMIREVQININSLEVCGSNRVEQGSVELHHLHCLRI